MQVVYAQDHWVAVGCDEDEVVLANSSGNAISPLVCQQMKQLYRHGVDEDGQLQVNVVRCMQQ